MHSPDRRTLLLAAGAAGLPFAACAGPSAGVWSPRRSLGWSVQEIYCAVSGGRIIIAGGLRRSDARTEIENRTGAYDPAADAWSEGPRLPAARHHPMLAADRTGRTFALGGYGRTEASEWTAMTQVWALDGDAWVEAARMPEPLSETVGAELDGRIHLATGRSPGAANGQWNDQVDVAAHWTFEPDSGRWTRAAPPPMARNSAAGAVLDGHLWVAGGRTVAGGGTGRLDRYDPRSDRWDTLAPIPRSKRSAAQVGGGLAMVACKGRLLAFGGEWFAPAGGGGVFAETWVYDPGRDAWSSGPDMRTPRHGLASAEVNGVVYALAGGAKVSGGQATGVVEALVPTGG